MDARHSRPFILRQRADPAIFLFIITVVAEEHGREETVCSLFTSTALDIIHPIPWQSRTAASEETWDSAYFVQKKTKLNSHA